MQPQTLDHIAIYAADRDGLATFLQSKLDWHVIDQTEKYLLLGPSATAGKLTIFHAPEGTTPELDSLVSIVLAGTEADSGTPLAAPEGLTFTFAAHDSAPRHAVIGLTVRSGDPAVCAARFVNTFGFSALSAHPNVAIVGVADETMTIVKEAFEPADQPVLFHLGLLVDSAQDHIDEAEASGIDIMNIVDAPNTYAVFVAGPCGVCLEYVEHKPEFALA